MSRFELVTVTYSFVLGLGIAQLLSSVSRVIRERRERSLHWLPLAFAAAIFAFHVQFWFALFNLEQVIETWTWPLYGSLLSLGVVLFLSGGLVLPGPGTATNDDLLTDFQARGRTSLGFVVAYLVGWIPLNAFFEGSWVTWGVAFNLFPAAALAIAWLAKTWRLQIIGSVLFLVLQAYGLVYQWATPMDLG